VNEATLRGLDPEVPVVGSVGSALLLSACDGGGSGSGSSQATGSLTVRSCTTAEGAPACLATISWTTNATSPRVLLVSATLATTATGSTTVYIGAGTQAVTLLDGAA
jgi:hypothetical protein